MKKLVVTLSILSMSIIGVAQLNTLSSKEKAEGWTLLFNGENLDGFTKMNGQPATGWKVIDGVLNNSGKGGDHGGDIITAAQYKNFELYVEWKIAPQSNSGIFFHVDPTKSSIIYETGPEYQLLDDNGWPTKLKPGQYSGANYDMHPPQNAKVNPIEDWNTTRIIVDGSRVKHFLNDVKVVEYELWSDEWKHTKEKSKWKSVKYYGMAKTGYIGFQDHGGLTQFRNIKIKKLYQE